MRTVPGRPSLWVPGYNRDMDQAPLNPRAGWMKVKVVKTTAWHLRWTGTVAILGYWFSYYFVPTGPGWWTIYRWPQALALRWIGSFLRDNRLLPLGPTLAIFGSLVLAAGLCQLLWWNAMTAYLKEHFLKSVRMRQD